MLDTHELLDRFELLYPEVAHLADLRRAAIDEDLSSLFRLLDGRSVNGSVDDLRRACLEGNRHSLFRLVEYEDLRKALLEDNMWSLLRVLEGYITTDLLVGLRRILAQNLDFNKSSMSRGQLKSKIWLIKELEKLPLNLGNIFLCAGWYGLLATLLFEAKLKIGKIRNFDRDPLVHPIAEIFNKKWLVDGWRFLSMPADIQDISYERHSWSVRSQSKGTMENLSESPDTIINTSCEHIPAFADWYGKIPTGKLLILQSNDFFGLPEHVNCVRDLEAFRASAPMTELLYAGELQLEKCKRFMLIGRK